MEDQQHAALDPIYPLGLPRGSVRALTTLLLLFATGFLMLSGREQLPVELSLGLVLCLSYYFANRQKGSRHRSPEPEKKEAPPLWLPNGTIRLILILGYGALIYFMLRKHDFQLGQIPGDAMLAMAMIGAFLLGSLIRPILDQVVKWTGERNTFAVVLGHIRGMIALTVTVAYVLGVVFEWTLFENDPQADVPQAAGAIFLAVIGFYFGNRN